MAIDPFIDQLVSDLKPVRRRSLRTDAIILAALCVIELAMFLGMGAMPSDMPKALAEPSFWWKLGSLALIAAVGGTVAVLSFDPARSPRRGLRWLVGVVLLCLAAGWLIDASRNGLPSLAERLNWREGLDCVHDIVMLSVPAVIALGVLMRRGAPTDAGGTSLAVGVAATAWGAFVFMFSCPFDDPLYVTVWSGVSFALVTLVARLVLPPLTRW